MFATGISNDGDVVSALILSPRPYPPDAVNGAGTAVANAGARASSVRCTFSSRNPDASSRSNTERATIALLRERYSTIEFARAPSHAQSVDLDAGTIKVGIMPGAVHP
jgi:hypothetical protein